MTEKNQPLSETGMKALNSERERSRQNRRRARAAEEYGKRLKIKLETAERALEKAETDKVVLAAKLARIEEKLDASEERNKELSQQVLKLLTAPTKAPSSVLNRMQNIISAK